jgi:hypothetical protein
VSRRDFAVLPAGAFARGFPLAIAATLALGGAIALVAGLDTPHVLLGAIPAVLLGLGVAVALALAIRNPRVRLEDGVLQAGRWPRVRVAARDLDPGAACVVDLAQHPEWAPTLKLFGTSMPGYRSGWFRLRDASRAFLVVTDPRRVLRLPRRDGGPLLLSLARPDDLLDALRRARG